jgi:hypothetical protein
MATFSKKYHFEPLGVGAIAFAAKTAIVHHCSHPFGSGESAHQLPLLGSVGVYD